MLNLEPHMEMTSTGAGSIGEIFVTWSLIVGEFIKVCRSYLVRWRRVTGGAGGRSHAVSIYYY